MVCCSSFFIVVGILSTAFIVLYVARVIYETFFYRADISAYQSGSGKDGAYAMITGPTSGIGEGFAYECARLGFNLLLVGRTESKLKDVIASITKQYPKIKATFVISDASAAGRVEVDRAVAAASKLPIRLLVNNVGVSNDPSMFSATSLAITEDMLQVNVRYSTLITAGVLPQLIAQKSNRCGIINISSISSRIHVPMLTVYCATKAYNLAFSNALRAELASNSSIDVLCITPGFVASEMTKIRTTSLSVCSSEQCARESMQKLGLREHAGYWYHHIDTKFILLSPAALRGPETIKLLTKMNAAREARLLKEQAQAKKQ